MYSKAYVIDGENRTEVLTFGPLCVDPAFQNKNTRNFIYQRISQK